MTWNIAQTMVLLVAINLAHSSETALHQIRRRNRVLSKPVPLPSTCPTKKSLVCHYEEKHSTYTTICVPDPSKQISKYLEDRLGRCEELCNSIEGCDDGNKCTSDTTKCDVTTGYKRVCTSTPTQCESPSTCDSTDGVCKTCFNPINCDDGLPCTVDTTVCNESTGIKECSHTPVQCELNHSCDLTTGNCERDRCTNELDCDDKDQCTTDSSICDESTRFEKICVHTLITCLIGESCNPTDGTCKPDDQLIPCIAVIDEDDSFPGEGKTQVQLWSEFRAAYPVRPFCLLVPGPAGYVNVPPSFVSDSLVVIHYNIRRDKGVVANAEDWFTKCKLNTLTSANVPFVGLFIDPSGTLGESEVAASRDLLYTTLTAKGITVKKVVNWGENWILPFLTTLVPPPP